MMFIIVLLGILFTIGIFAFILSSDKRINKSLLETGIELWATVKNVDFKREYNFDNKVYNINYLITYEFNYKEMLEKTLELDIYTHPEKPKIGDKVLCLYDPEKDYFDIKENVESNSNYSIIPALSALLLIAISLFIPIFSISHFYNIFTNSIKNSILEDPSPLTLINSTSITLLVLVPLLSLFALLAFSLFIVFKRLKKPPESEECEIINTKIIEIICRSSTKQGSRGVHYNCIPVVEFPHAGKEYVYILGIYPYISTNIKKYKIGDELKIKFYPEIPKVL